MHLVLLHPLPLDGTVWSTGLRALGDRTIAPTLYDLGDSIRDWAGGALDLAGPGPLVVVGNSIGGSCAIEMAKLAPRQVRLIVLIGAKAAHRPEPRLRDRAVHLLQQEGMSAAWPLYWQPLFAPNADAAIVERARSTAFAQTPESIVRGVRAFHARPDRAAFLDGVEVPVAIVRGEHDRIPRDGEMLAQRLHRGTFHLVKGAGHYVPLERPPALAGIVEGHMKKLG